MFMLMEGANRWRRARVGLLGIRGGNQKVKLSELIARLAEMLEEHGDIPAMVEDQYRSDYDDVQEVRFDELRKAILIG